MSERYLPAVDPNKRPGRGQKGDTMADDTDHPTDLSRYAALLFDLDGVITRTATLHAAAWKELFDHFLAERAGQRAEPFVAFDTATDYLLHVDGRRRYDGV